MRTLFLGIIVVAGCAAQSLAAQPAPAHAAPQVAPAHPPARPATHPGEDCVNVDPDDVETANTAGDWKVVEDDATLLDFGPNAEGAKRAVDVIQHYHFTKQCFVKRPGASMMYWRNGVAIPPGNMAGQDCIGLNPSTTAALYLDGRWKVMDGKNWLLDYGQDRGAADQAVNIIHSYGLNRECFVLRPHVTMQYWLEQ